MQSLICLKQLNPGDELATKQWVQTYFEHDGLTYNDLVAEGMQTLLKNPQWGAYYEIVTGDKAVGYCCLTYTFDSEVGGRFGYVTDFYLKEEHRGQGIGSIVLDLLNEKAKEVGLKEVGLVVLDHNPNARRFYERHGFEVMPGRTHLYRPVT